MVQRPGGGVGEVSATGRQSLTRLPPRACRMRSTGDLLRTDVLPDDARSAALARPLRKA